jgi:hypothetical protein
MADFMLCPTEFTTVAATVVAFAAICVATVVAGI